MNQSLCGANCAKCPSIKSCKGCAKTHGAPHGRLCFIANYAPTGSIENYHTFKQRLINEINALDIEGMDEVTELYPLVGSFVNLEYPLPNGNAVNFLNSNEIYLGAQVKSLFDNGGKTCRGVIARENFILVCEYGENGVAPELALFKRR